MVFENAHLRAKRGWLRLRDEGQSVTLTYKQSTATTSAIDTLLEAEVGISDFAGGQQLLEALGFEPLRYQENYREEWALDGVKLDFDTWPGLPTFLEIEGPNEESVKLAAKKLGLNFADATFGSVDEVYSRELGIDILQKPELTFDCR
ncbi:class IV adenylate cyclase [Gandjariella thermophila]|nr:CYTH domain-containing protein [Gandjariella thermophila]